MEQDQQEFYATLAIAGGLVLAGILVVVVLWFFAIAAYNKISKKKMANEIMNAGRKNGRHETRGKF